MRAVYVLPALAALIFASGCVHRPVALVHAVPPHGLTVAVQPEIKGPAEPSYRTVLGQTARARGGDGGLVGLLITSGVRSASESDGQHYVRTLSSAACDERELLRLAIAEQMHKAGFQVSDSSDPTVRLQLKLLNFGLREVQSASAVPFVTVSAKLIRADGHAVWSATAQSCGIERKRAEDYSPDIYRDAFRSVADDLAMQLIRGPIRPIETSP